MSISMQGAWTIRVKSKDAAYAQEFIVSGAAHGNGTYSGTVGTVAVVSGNNWAITIKNNPGSGFVFSKERIKFPTVSNGMFHFDIQSNDAGGDTDFNDLILTCSTPNDGQTFVVYGNVSYYDDACMINPCFRRYIVIDSVKALAEAVKVRPLYDSISKYYPHRLFEVPKVPITGGDPGPVEFKSLVMPLEGEPVIPTKKVMTFQLKEMTTEIASEKKKPELLTFNAVSSLQSVPISTNTNRLEVQSSVLAKASIANLFDRLYCESGPLPNSILRFQEYDRTHAELNGSPYSGNGYRENLGQCICDDYGNYVFRFSRNVFDYLGETYDIAAGEDAYQQIMPDLIAQLVDGGNILNATYESSPHWNIPFLYRLNICIPKSRVGSMPFNCDGQSIIQRIGDIMVPLHGGVRGTVDNNLSSSGVITAHAIHSPNVNCASWKGTLEMWGCLNDPNIKYYTVEFNNGSGWDFVTEDCSIPRMVFNHVTNQYEFKNVSVNSFVNLRIHGNANPAVMTHCFLNAETDPPSVPDHNQWMITTRNIKAYLTTSRYILHSGPVQFRLVAYAANGNHLNASESITLFLDNETINVTVDPTLTMNGVTSNDCSLFCVKDAPAAPLTVRFKAILKSGFMGQYYLFMYKGAANPWAISPPVKNAVISGGLLNIDANSGRTYVFASPCQHNFTGTDQESTADGNGYYQVDLTPGSPNTTWLVNGETFCAFTIQLAYYVRQTNGKTGNWGDRTPPIAIGIQSIC